MRTSPALAADSAMPLPQRRPTPPAPPAATPAPPPRTRPPRPTPPRPPVPAHVSVVPSDSEGPVATGALLLAQALCADPAAEIEAAANPQPAAHENALLAHARQVMNALRTLAPLVRAAAAQGGLPQEQATRFSAFVRTAQDFAAHWVRHEGGRPDDPARAVQMRLLERLWVEAAGPGAPAIPAELRAAWIAAAETRLIETEATSPHVLEVRLALARTLAHTLRTRDAVPTPSGVPWDAACTDLWMRQTAESLQSLLPPLTSDAERARAAAVLMDTWADLWLDAVEQERAAPRPGWESLVRRFRGQAIRLTHLAAIPRPRRGRGA